VVSSDGGEGVPGAELTFSRGSTAAGVRAERDGTFAFDPPTEGRWLLAAVTAPGYLPFAPEWDQSPIAFDARAGSPIRGVEIQLSPAVALVATVLDPKGRPAPDAEVRVLGAAREAALVPIEDRFTTDAAGQVRLAAPRGAVVEARKPGFAPGRALVDLVARAERRLTLRLGEGGGTGAAARISGRVVARGAGPVPGALVVAEADLGYGAGVLAGQAVTGADGAFDLGPLDLGKFRLTARAEGRARAVQREVAAGTRGVTLELPSGARLRGCVRDAGSGAPVTAFTVLVADRRGAISRRPAKARSFFAATGCWSLDDLTPGPAAVVVVAPGYAASAEVQADVPESGEAVADAALPPAGRLSGVVVDAVTRAPLPGARVSLEGTLPDAASILPVLGESVADGQGRFGVDGLSQRFSLAVAADGHHVRLVSGLQVAPGATAGPIEVALTPTLPGEEPRRELTGVGVSVAPGDDGLVVAAVLAGGSAADAGLSRGDAILAVDGVDVSSLGFGGAIDAIRGAEGTTVLLQIRRGSATFEVRIGRRLVRG
jgi:hypothetical protein